MVDIATRPVWWHVDHVWAMYVLLIPTLAVFGWGVYRRVRLWRLGQPAVRWDQPGRRLRRVIRHGIGQARTLGEPIVGGGHALLFWTMGLLFAGSLIVAIHQDLGIRVMQGWFYLVYQSLILDLAGATAIGALSVLLFARYIRRVRRLQPAPGGNCFASPPWILPSLLLLLCLQGFALEALRIAATDDPWAGWSPGGLAMSSLFRGMSPDTIVDAYPFVWWFHLLTTYATTAYLPFSSLFHVVTASLNVYCASLEPPSGELRPIDFEATERLGVGELRDFTWKDLLDLDACTACGRCDAVCPAYQTGKPLSPRELILDLRDQMSVISVALSNRGRHDASDGMVRIGGETLWACTTCHACVDACPVFVEHIPKVVGLRRHLVMEESSAPDGALDALRALEARAHPYRGATVGRREWASGLEVPLLCDGADMGETEYLLWVGCAAAFDRRVQKVARAFAQVLIAAGVRFAILGDEETCTGDPARRIGHEFLYDSLARQSIETLRRYRFKTIVTICPHCLNQLAGEYSRLGGTFSVVHHSQLIRQLLDDGRLKLDPAATARVRATYHDPCYLGRYQGEYDAPRAIIATVGGRLIDMPRSRSRAFCCGAGGGHAWIEEMPGTPRINHVRAREALATGAKVVCTACPFCLQMMEDGVKTSAGSDESVDAVVKDIAELVAEAIP
ncbi:MAG: (Fe-S)-binding protein [Chloroflexi bacterium]|nr:(Fe-S)-binding protein [Chloroflexota bacterium]